jgi:glycosyltransferase involved in cell wall biosynthesis
VKRCGGFHQFQLKNALTLFLFPTRQEGFSLSVLEAMACAKPIVTHNCSSLPEQVVDKKGGFLCEVDNIDEIVEKIHILAADKTLRKEMGRFNRERVERYFTLKQMTENYLKLYQEVLTRVTD